MGPLNTVYQDIAPYYDDDDKTLFFSTNGRQGFGGLDIFKAQGPRLGEISNMGIPFNTNRDEFYLSLGKEKGLLSSNREGGKGTDDIYYFNIESSELLLATIGKDDLGKGDNFSLITNLHYKPEGDPAVDVPVLLTDQDGNVILRATSDELGTLSFDDLSPDKEYKLILETDDDNIYADIIYKGKSGEFDLNAQKNGAVLAVITKAIIDQFNSMTILSKISYSETGEPAMDVPIVLVDENGVIMKRGKTNADGLARFEELNSDRGYRILIDEDDPRLTADVKFLVDDIRVKWQRNGNAVSVPGESTGVAQGDSRVTFENVYFDFNDFAIRKEGRKTLNEIAKYLKDNKEVQIEINANADNVGSDNYNNELSEKRGQAVVAYLENSGVDKSSIVVNVLGAKNPIASNETPIGRQLNRRVEFYLVGGQGYSTQVMTYVLEPNKSLNDVADAFGMSTSELKEMNNLGSEADFRVFVPLRVRKTGDNNLIAPVSMAAASSDKYKNMKDPLSQSGISGSRNSGSKASLPSLEPGMSYHIVEPLETLFKIAYSYGMTVKEIKSANNLNSEIIQIGQAIIVKDNASKKLDPGPGKYVVKEGDTLYDIAKAHGVSTKQIMEWNNLDSPVLYETMVLKVSKE
jgi:outer membrane protein OmpA-like peptidoglycan-associated protein